MPKITAAMVKSLRDRTRLPMMKCKEALEKTDGDEDAAVELLRKEGAKFTESRGDRETSAGCVAILADPAAKASAMIELQCESAPVTKNDGFRQMVADLVAQLAGGPGAATPEELLSQPSPSRQGETLMDQLNELTGQIREVFKLARIKRIDASCGGYAHYDGAKAVLLELEGGNAEAAKDVSMHVVAMQPKAVNIEDLDPALVAKEREILTEAARTEGKPDNIIEKMVDGRMRNFYAETVLNEQPFVKDDKQTVGKYSQDAGLKVLGFTYWELGGGESA